jgi:hypothetical protein
MSIAERSPNIESLGEQPAEIKSIVASSVIGTAVEWYDFLIYGATSALAFNKLLMACAALENRDVSQNTEIGMRRTLVPPITPAARSEVQAEQHQLKSQLVPPSAVLLGVFFVSDDAGFPATSAIHHHAETFPTPSGQGLRLTRRMVPSAERGARLLQSRYSPNGQSRVCSLHCVCVERSPRSLLTLCREAGKSRA